MDGVDKSLDEIKFCPSCGYEGTDSDCPVCNIKMESQENEIKRLAKADEKEDLPDDQLSLKAQREKECLEQIKENDQDQDI